MTKSSLYLLLIIPLHLLMGLIIFEIVAILILLSTRNILGDATKKSAMKGDFGER